MQTGCEKESEDIIMHRRIIGMDLTEEDKKGITCPYVFKYPASPHLSARLENRSIDIDVITDATKELSAKYDFVLMEGVGGIYVPLNDDVMLPDYIKMRKYPVIVVTTPKLGSINHNLLTLEAIEKRELDVYAMIYNCHPKQETEIVQDTRNILEKAVSQQWFDASIIDIPIFTMGSIPDIDFSGLF